MAIMNATPISADNAEMAANINPYTQDLMITEEVMNDIAKLKSVWKRLQNAEKAIDYFQKRLQEDKGSLNELEYSIPVKSKNGTEDAVLGPDFDPDFESDLDTLTTEISIESRTGVLPFIKKCLSNEGKYNDMIRWINKKEKEFKIVDPERFASIYGKEKQKHMDKRKLSRCLGYQITKKGNLQKCEAKGFVYKIISKSNKKKGKYVEKPILDIQSTSLVNSIKKDQNYKHVGVKVGGVRHSQKLMEELKSMVREKPSLIQKMIDIGNDKQNFETSQQLNQRIRQQRNKNDQQRQFQQQNNQHFSQLQPEQQPNEINFESFQQEEDHQQQQQQHLQHQQQNRKQGSLEHPIFQNYSNENDTPLFKLTGSKRKHDQTFQDISSLIFSHLDNDTKKSKIELFSRPSSSCPPPLPYNDSNNKYQGQQCESNSLYLPKDMVPSEYNCPDNYNTTYTQTAPFTQGKNAGLYLGHLLDSYGHPQHMHSPNLLHQQNQQITTNFVNPIQQSLMLEEPENLALINPTFCVAETITTTKLSDYLL